MSAYEFLSPESFVAKSLLDGSLIEDLSFEKTASSKNVFGKLSKNIAALARISHRNANAGAPFAAHYAA